MLVTWVPFVLGFKGTWAAWIKKLRGLSGSCGYIKLSRGSKICGISRMLNLLPNVHAQTLIILLSILQVFMDFRKCIFLKRSKTKYWVKFCRIVSSNCFKNRLASGFSSSTFYINGGRPIRLGSCNQPIFAKMPKHLIPHLCCAYFLLF